MSGFDAFQTNPKWLNSDRDPQQPSPIRLNPLDRNERFPSCYISSPFPGFILTLREFIALVGGTISWSFAARGQQLASTYRIAVIHPSLPVAKMMGNQPGSPYFAFFAELRRLGYVEGKNLQVERYSTIEPVSVFCTRR